MKNLFSELRSFLLIIAIALAIGLYLQVDIGDVEVHSHRMSILRQAKDLDARLDRQVMHVTSFRMLEYDGLAESSNRMQQLIKDMRDSEYGLYGNIDKSVGKAADIYVDAIQQKLRLLERIKYISAVVKNGLNYLPELVMELHAIGGDEQNRLADMAHKLFLFNLSRDDFDVEEIRTELSGISLTHKMDKKRRDLLDGIILNIQSDLTSMARLTELQKRYDSVSSMQLYDRLYTVYTGFHARDIRTTRWFSFVMLGLSALLLLMLWLLLGRLHDSGRKAEQSWVRLHDAVDSLSEAFALFDEEGKLVLNNRKWREFYPWLQGHLAVGTPLSELRRLSEDHFSVVSSEGHDVSREIPPGKTTIEYTQKFANGNWYLASDNRTAEGGLACVRVDITDAKNREVELRKLSQAVEQSPVSVVITDINGDIEYVNPQHEKTSGYRADEVVGTKLKSGNMGHQQYREMWDTLSAGKVWRGYFHNLTKEGAEYWESVSISPVRDEQGAIANYIAVKEDITHRKLAEDQLSMNAAVFETASEGIMVTDADNLIKTVNPAFSRITGYSEHEVLGKNPKILSSGRHDRAFYYQMWDQIKDEGYWSGEVWNRRKDGGEYPEWLSIVVIKDEAGEVKEYVSVFSDITKRKRDEEQIMRQAYYDALTGLPNRSLLFDRLAQGTIAARREGWLLALLFIDLDRFKEINDTLGHVVGDELLQDVSSRLKDCVREVDTVARFGGDEFVLLLQDLNEVNDAAVVADKVIDVLSEPFVLAGREVHIGASIGITLYPTDADNAEAMLRNADMAMYRAKEAGRNRYQYFTQGMQEQVAARVGMERDLRQALERDELELYYQPIIETETKELVSVEALLRWNHPTIGMVPPDKFIPLAEENGLIGVIGDWVLKTACAQARVWRDSGVSIGVSVNLSYGQRSMGLSSWSLASILKDTGLEGEALTLEITEGLLMEDSSDVIEWLLGFKRLGVSLSVDDFGTGYSSLSYLKKFPVDVLKIDRSFIKDMVDNQEDASLVSAILAMGKSLGLKLVAEGVEDDKQMKMLTEYRCDYLQGYLLGIPMPADVLQGWFLTRTHKNWIG